MAGRFANPRPSDTIPRLCQDGSNRQPSLILPVLRDRLAAGAAVDGLALALALWCQYCAGMDEAGHAIPQNDDCAADLHAGPWAFRNDPGASLADDAVFGDRGRDPRLAAPIGAALRALWADGVAATLADYVRS